MSRKPSAKLPSAFRGFIDVALYEAVLQVMESLIPEYHVSGEIRERSGSILPGIAPSNVYPCRDGDYMIGANKDELFARLAVAMGQSALADDPRYATHVARGVHQTELDDIIARWTRTLSMAEVEAAMNAASIPAGRIYRAPEMLADPHFAARGAIATVETERWGPVKMQGCCPHLSATPSAIRTAAPVTVGADSDAIYAERLGLNQAEIERLRDSGVI